MPSCMGISLSSSEGAVEVPSEPPPEPVEGVLHDSFGLRSLQAFARIPVAPAEPALEHARELATRSVSAVRFAAAGALTGAADLGYATLAITSSANVRRMLVRSMKPASGTWGRMMMRAISGTVITRRT